MSEAIRGSVYLFGPTGDRATLSVWITNRKKVREREGGGVPGLGERGMEGWMDGEHRREGRDQQEKRKTEEEGDCLISVCTYQHMDH